MWQNTFTEYCRRLMTMNFVLKSGRFEIAMMTKYGTSLKVAIE